MRRRAFLRRRTSMSATSRLLLNAMSCSGGESFTRAEPTRSTVIWSWSNGSLRPVTAFGPSEPSVMRSVGFPLNWGSWRDREHELAAEGSWIPVADAALPNALEAARRLPLIERELEEARRRVGVTEKRVRATRIRAGETERLLEQVRSMGGLARGWRGLPSANQVERQLEDHRRQRERAQAEREDCWQLHQAHGADETPSLIGCASSNVNSGDRRWSCGNDRTLIRAEVAEAREGDR